MNKKIIIGILLIMIFSFIIPQKSMGFLFWDDPIYKEPSGNPDGSMQGKGIDDIIRDAEAFEQERGGTVGAQGSQAFEINQGRLQDFSSNLFSVLLIAATAISVLVGILIGIKYMIGSVEEKAKYKEWIVPYLAGCAAVYGAFGIWKLLVTVLGSV